MSLDLGELVGYLKLDSSDWDSKVEGMPKTVTGKAAAMGAAGLLIGGALAAAMVGGINDAMDFDQTLANTEAQMGLTEQQAAKAGRIAGETYGQNFGDSMEQNQQAVAAIMTQLDDMKGATDESLESMTAKVLTFSSAFETEPSEAINAVQQLLSSGLVSSSDEAMDLMTASMQRVPEALRGDMMDAINEYGPFLAEMGYSGQEAFDLLASGADRGTYGIDKAGDALKELTIRSTDMSTASTDAYKAIGLDAEDMAAKMLAGGDQAREATDQIVNGLLGMGDPAAQAQAAIALFGTPLEDLGTSEIPAFLEGLTSLGGGMEDTAGAAQGMVDTMGGTAASGFEAFKRQVQLVFADLGEQLLPALLSVANFLNEHSDMLLPIIIGLGALAVALGVAAAAQWIMNSALLASPMTWIIVGIMAVIAAVVLLVMYWDEVVAWLGNVWSAVVDWFKGTLDSIAQWWNSVWSSVSTFFKGLWQGISAFFKGLWDGLVGWLKGSLAATVAWWNGIWRGVGAAWSSFWRGIWTTLQGIWNTLVSWFKAALNAYVSFWRGIWNGVGAAFRAVWTTLKSWAVTLVSGWISAWKGLWNGLKGFFSGLWSSISTGITSAWDGILGFFRDLPSTIKGFFSGIGSWLYNSGRDLVQGLLNGVRSLASTIGSFFLNLLPGWIKGPFKAALGIASPSKLFAEYGVNTIEGYLKGIEDGKVDLDREMSNLIDQEELRVASNFTGSQAPQEARSATETASRQFHYHAAENRSLSAEEELFAALSSPRAKGGK